MLGRKGVLIADPSVAAMTDAQWVFEFHALQKAEDAKVELMKVQLETLKRLLGLDLFATEETSYIPLALMTGHPEMLQSLREQQSDEEKAQAAADDVDFDEWSSKVAAGEIDLDDLIPAEPEEEQLIQFSQNPRVSFDQE